MTCPKCNANILYVNDESVDDKDETTMITTEFYICPECRHEFERIVTYEVTKEVILQ